MMQSRYIKNNHINDSDIARFNALLMDTDELLDFAEHTGSCRECAQRLAESAEKSPLHVPKGFAPEVRNTIASEAQRDFRNYCLRVCAAVCASLVILFTNGFDVNISKMVSKPKEFPVPKLEFFDKMNQRITEFSNNIINWEVDFNGKKK